MIIHWPEVLAALPTILSLGLLLGFLTLLVILALQHTLNSVSYFLDHVTDPPADLLLQSYEPEVEPVVKKPTAKRKSRRHK